MVLSSLGHFDDFCESETLFWQQLIFFLYVPLIIVIVHRTICGERGRELQIVNEEGKNCCNCHSYLLYLHCTGFSPMQNSQENQQQHNMQILGCVMLVELRVPSFSSIISSIYYFLIYIKYLMRFKGCVAISHRLHN